MNFPTKIAILGVGLIGGSIALGLKKHFGAKITIFGSCNHPKRAKQALDLGIIDEVLKQPHFLPRDVEVVIISTPIFSILKLLKLLPADIQSHTLVIDVGSTKDLICREAERLLSKSISFVGTHPMAGSEKGGFENADVFLFRNKPWIICPTKLSNANDILMVKNLVEILGGKAIIMNPKVHDELTSLASHLFLALTSILVNLEAKQKEWQDVASIASTGFRDTTRLASHDPKMKKDILLTNKKNIIVSLNKVNMEIRNFISLLSEGNEQTVLNYLQQAKSVRDHWLSTI